MDVPCPPIALTMDGVAKYPITLRITDRIREKTNICPATRLALCLSSEPVYCEIKAVPAILTPIPSDRVKKMTGNTKVIAATSGVPSVLLTQ